MPDRPVASVIEGLKVHPVGLALVVINVLFIGSALYFLNNLADAAIRNREQLMKDNSAQFDALMRLCGDRFWQQQLPGGPTGGQP